MVKVGLIVEGFISVKFYLEKFYLCLVVTCHDNIFLIISAIPEGPREFKSGGPSLQDYRGKLIKI